MRGTYFWAAVILLCVLAAPAYAEDNDLAADAARLSKKYNVPYDMAERNIEELRRKEAIDAVDFTKIIQCAPEANEWLAANEANPALIRGNAGIFARMRHIFKDFASYAGAGANDFERNRLYAAMNFRQLTPEEKSRVAALDASLEKFDYSGSWLRETILGAAFTAYAAFGQMLAGFISSMLLFGLTIGSFFLYFNFKKVS